jgi:AmiR/NasT family two-component response regulator
LVAQLVRSGENLEAGQLLIRRRGCSSTEAHKLVEEQANRI